MLWVSLVQTVNQSFVLMVVDDDDDDELINK